MCQASAITKHNLITRLFCIYLLSVGGSENGETLVRTEGWFGLTGGDWSRLWTQDHQRLQLSHAAMQGRKH